VCGSSGGDVKVHTSCVMHDASLMSQLCARTTGLHEQQACMRVVVEGMLVGDDLRVQLAPAHQTPTKCIRSIPFTSQLRLQPLSGVRQKGTTRAHPSRRADRVTVSCVTHTLSHTRLLGHRCVKCRLLYLETLMYFYHQKICNNSNDGMDRLNQRPTKTWALAI